MKYFSRVKVRCYRPYLVILLCVVLLACSTFVASSGQTQVQQVRNVNSFIDSIGVAVHLRYKDTAYGEYNDIIKPRLQELGIRHIRDGVPLSDTTALEKLSDLSRIGIKSTLVMDPRETPGPEEAVKIAKILADSIEAVEGPNEWDLHPKLKYKGKSFPQGVREYQAELYSAIKEDPETSHLAVLAPSLGRAKRASKLGKVACDIGTMHSYPGGKIPSWKLNHKWMKSARAVCGDKSIIATESGYHNAVHKTVARSQPGVSELAAGKYAPRLFLEYFNWGIRRAYDYELINLKPDPTVSSPKFNYGLLRNDGSPKPAFTAIKNLIALLKSDTVSETFPLRSLSYALHGDTTNVHHTLLQRHDGSLYLILWQEVPSFDLKANKDIPVPERALQLTLNTQISQAAIYQPNNSTSPIKKYKNPERIELQVPDHPLVVKLIPG